MFSLESSLDASSFVKSRDIYDNNFKKVLNLINYCYNILISEEKPHKYPKKFQLEIHLTKMLVSYLKKYKFEFGLDNLGFELEVGLEQENGHLKFLDIKVCNVSHYFMDAYIEDIYYAIECKRLDESSDKITYYIKGGILRFVKSEYAKNLHSASMVGYVENGNLNKIIDKINVKLKAGLADIETEKLLNKYVINRHNSCYHSIHLKYDSAEKIDIYHLILDYQPILK